MENPRLVDLRNARNHNRELATAAVMFAWRGVVDNMVFSEELSGEKFIKKIIRDTNPVKYYAN